MERIVMKHVKHSENEKSPDTTNNEQNKSDECTKYAPFFSDKFWDSIEEQFKEHKTKHVFS